MISRIHISNYAIIDDLVLTPEPGMTVITGETGAGKSILLGALAMILGSRADTGVLSDKSRKCIIEAEFDISELGLNWFFDEHDLDYAPSTLIRREVSAEGKSRAFINDTPVNLAVLKELGSRLIDIHSQHETLTINESEFQMYVVDSLSGNLKSINTFSIAYRDFRKTQEELRLLIEQKSKLESEYEFNRFQFDELDSANLMEGELQNLEAEQKMLDGASDLRDAISKSTAILNSEPLDAIAAINSIIQMLVPLEQVYPFVSEWVSRLRSVVIELKDIVSDMEGGGDKVNFDPQRASYVNDRTDLLNRLLRKHRVDSIDKLISLRNQLSSSVYSKDELELKISATRKTIGKMESDLQKSALEIREARSKAIPTIQKKVVSLLKEVGMKNADFEIRLTALDNFGFRNNGSDSVEFVFSANKGSDLKPLQKVASGGELSRLMLCIKSLLAEKSGLPTLIFDEIDTGVSGEIAFRIGSLIREMSKGRQILVITHLPQMAAHGTDHFRVSKSTLGQKTQTQITRLSKDERVDELARMLSGELLTEAAKANARELLSVND